MKTFDLVVRPVHSALLIGGQTDPAAGGHKATARGQGGALLLPGTALRGALRIELERLLRGRNSTGTVCSANRPAATPDEPACGCPVCRIFGEPGTTTGTLRLGDGRFESERLDARAFAVRPQVGVSRKSGSAAEDHLVFYETSPAYGAGEEVRFRARAELVPRLSSGRPDDLEEDLRHLEAACRALRAVGAGKARGLGWVVCKIENLSSVSPPSTSPLSQRGDRGGISADASAVRVLLHAKEPLHFADGRPEGYYHATRRDAPASTVRGALAFALLEQGMAKAEDEGFQQLFVGEEAACFGTAQPVLDGEVFRPALTLQQCRGPGAHTFDDLVPALLARRAAQHGLGLAQTRVCPASGCTAHKADAAPPPKLTVRTRTRVALNRRTGTSMDAKLYSQEALEPPLTLAAEVHGLAPAGSKLLAALHGRSVRLGGKRSKGFGLCEVEIQPIASEGAHRAMTAIEGLHGALNEGWKCLEGYAPDGLRAGFPSTYLDEDDLPLAIQLVEPWHPPTPSSQAAEELLREGPLGKGSQAGKGKARLLGAFIRFATQGRFPSVEGQRAKAPERAGETGLLQTAAPGTVYVYAVARSDLEAHLREWLLLGSAGRGAFGWGRFVVRGQDSASTTSEETR